MNVQPGAAAAARIVVEGITKRFGTENEVLAIDRIDFDVKSGEFLTIVGPSGCGKSTVLNMLAGLSDPTSGRILIDGKVEQNRRRHFGYMFQKDVLFPWRTIAQNVAVGAEVLGARKRDALAEARALLARFDLEAFADHYPSQLSGGMRQRAALMRTLLCKRDMLLLDEPLGALDALTRQVMQEWLMGVWMAERCTVILITHDVEEAVFLSQRVLTMSARPGRIKDEVAIDLDYPRTYEALTSKRLIELKRHILAQIHEDSVRATMEGGIHEVDHI
jgi:ABC-type nitrate/sulfonate/bicarbonate transport system ATPase subunit